MPARNSGALADHFAERLADEADEDSAEHGPLPCCTMTAERRVCHGDRQADNRELSAGEKLANIAATTISARESKMKTFVSNREGARQQQDMKLYVVQISPGEVACRRTP
jgi:hypothetical protein